MGYFWMPESHGLRQWRVTPPIKGSECIQNVTQLMMKAKIVYPPVFRVWVDLADFQEKLDTFKMALCRAKMKGSTSIIIAHIQIDVSEKCSP